MVLSQRILKPLTHPAAPTAVAEASRLQVTAAQLSFTRLISQRAACATRGGKPDCVSGMPGRHGNLGLLRKMLDFGSEIRREFGTRLHHHIQGLGYSPGPFCCPEVPRGAGFRPVVLRVGIRHNTPISAFLAPSPSLFSVCAAGRRRTLCRRIKHLRRAVQRQPRGPITHRTPPQPRVAPPTRPAAGGAGTTAGSCTEAAGPQR